MNTKIVRRECEQHESQYIKKMEHTHTQINMDREKQTGVKKEILYCDWQIIERGRQNDKGIVKGR